MPPPAAQLPTRKVEHLETSVGEWLTGGDLKSAMANKTIIYNVIYGVPCTIDLHADGRMVGTAGYANEDCDVGRWHRQWNEWVYGEERAYYVVVNDDRIKWFNADHQLVDSAFIRAMAQPA